MKRILPALVCGFGAGVLNTALLALDFNCCLIMPAAAVFTLLLDQKANRSSDRIRPGKAIKLGLLTGLFAALFTTFFELLIVFILKDSALMSAWMTATNQFLTQSATADIPHDVLELVKNYIHGENSYLVQHGFSSLYSIGIFLLFLMILPIMSLIGGLLGMGVLNSRRKEL